MNIEITSDPEKRIAIAKTIAAEKSSYYTEKVLSGLRKAVEMRADESWSEERIDGVLYDSIYHYWAYGSAIEEYFYYEFAKKTHEQKKTYMTKREKVIYTNALNRIEDAHILQNKFETYQLLSDYYRRDMILCDSMECFDEFRQFVTKHPVFVVKPWKLGGGQGVHVDSVAGLSSAQIKEKYDCLLKENTEINNRLNSWGGVGAFLVEELIEQAEPLKRIHPQSVNGVRVSTLRVGGKIVVYQPWFRIGCGDSFVDNAFSGGLMAGIDPETGFLDTDGFSEKPEIVAVHPNTGIQIKGFQIPGWNELISIVKELSSKFTTINYIGWDMVLTTKGWAVMEGNFRGSFTWQLFRQRGMKAEFEELTGIHLSKEFWWQE